MFKKGERVEVKINAGNVIFLSRTRVGMILSECEVGRGKMNVQLIANEKNEDRAQC